ncbi:MAG: CHAT domain-containing protein [Lewinellaceae bacterium]|nr:CHAT domain-containing protein [Saprospiraceae bacterium]MCB9345297.1 CHAT domain-containing protein [Lewinellaceae bacterium]
MIKQIGGNLFLRAMVVSTLALLVFMAIAQGSGKPQANIDPEPLIKKLNTLLSNDEYEAAIPLADSVARIFEANGMRDAWYKALTKKAIAQKYASKAENGIVELQSIIERQTIDDCITANLNGLLGYACLNAGQYEMGAEYYEQCLAGLVRNHCESGIGLAYMNLGFSLKGKGDYREARQYYLAAIPLLTKQGDTTNLEKAYINLSDISRYIFDFKAAREFAQQAFQFSQDMAMLTEHLGLSDIDEGLYSSALTHFSNSLKYGSPPEDIYRFMGSCAEKLGDTVKANYYFNEALKIAPDTRDSAIVRYYIGNALLNRKQPEAALQVFQQSLHGFFPILADNNPSDNLEVGLAKDFWSIALLCCKAKAFRDIYLKSNNPSDLKQGDIAIKTAVVAIDSLRSGMKNETSGQDAVDYVYATYETAIQISRQLEKVEPGVGHLSNAYAFAERSKANTLKTNLAEKDLRQSANIPDSLLWQENKAKAFVARWEGKNQDSLLSAIRHLEKIRNAIEKHSPLLALARAQYQVTPLTSLQQNLDSDELLLQYFWGDQSVIVFSLRKNGVNIHDIPITEALETSIRQFEASLTDYQGKLSDYETAANEVYHQFCEPALANVEGVKRLLIIPDGPLSTLPFEAFQAEKGRYLIKDYSISYHWSGALWLQARKRGMEKGLANGYAGFAPKYKANSKPMAMLGNGLSDLPEARKAVEEVAKTWSGKVFQGSEVSKALFLKKAGKFDILHLAMHGLLNKDVRTQTGLAFPVSGDSIEILNTLEISQMELPAQLAVLSACNTGNGAVFRGEGVMSLSRAFALAGCPALTANLWEVPSVETNKITTAFLQSLKKEIPKDQALRAAKLAFIESADPARQHPFFWAGQVLIGYEGPVRQPVPWCLYSIAAFALAGVIFFAWRYWRSLR